MQIPDEQLAPCLIHAATPWQTANCQKAAGYGTYKPTGLARAPEVLPATERATLQHTWPHLQVPVHNKQVQLCRVSIGSLRVWILDLSSGEKPVF